MKLPALILTLVMLTGCVTEPDTGGSLLGPGDDVPEFSVTLSDGTTCGSRELSRDGGILVFFNTECPDCRRELPKLQTLHAAHPEVMILCMAREESQERIAAFWADNELTLPYSPQPDRRVYSLFATEGIPRIYLIGKGGKIAYSCGPDCDLENIFANIGQKP